MTNPTTLPEALALLAALRGDEAARRAHEKKRDADQREDRALQARMVKGMERRARDQAKAMADVVETNRKLGEELRRMHETIDRLVKALGKHDPKAVALALKPGTAKEGSPATKAGGAAPAGGPAAEPAPADAPAPAKPSAELAKPPTFGSEDQKAEPKTGYQTGRKPLPSSLPVTTDPPARPDACGACGCRDVRTVDEAVHQQLDYVPGHFRVRRRVCKVVQCAMCLRRTSGERAPAPFARALCSPALLAQVVYSKFCLALPLDRMQKDFSRMGVPLSVSTLSNWVILGARGMTPVVEAIWRDLKATNLVHTDGTGLPVLIGAGKAYNGNVWIFGGEGHAVYRYLPTKDAKELVKAFGTYKGTVVADAASNLNLLFGPNGCTEQGCESHGIRKFKHDCSPEEDELAKDGAAWVRAMFYLEAQARTAGLVGEKLLEWRQTKIKPVADEFRRWLEQVVLLRTLPKDELRKAAQYHLNHWDALTHFLQDPRVPMDNNLAERLLRAVAIGRKNYLFAASPAGAHAACVFYSLIGTCKQLGLDPLEYLTWLFTVYGTAADSRDVSPSDVTPHAYVEMLDERNSVAA